MKQEVNDYATINQKSKERIEEKTEYSVQLDIEFMKGLKTIKRCKNQLKGIDSVLAEMRSESYDSERKL